MSSRGSDNRERPSRSPRRGGLGRGLDALIPQTLAPATIDSGADVRPEDSASSTTHGARMVPTSALAPNPWQPRAHMDRQHLDELAASIRTHGVVQPIIVAPTERDDAWHIIAGERRWRAAQRAGLDRVPVVVLDAAPQAMLELALVENIVRADLNPLEEATAFQRLIEEFGLSQTELAGRIGRSRVAVSNTLRLLNAPEAVKDALLRGHITEGHARALLGLPVAADQIEALRLVVEGQMSVRQTEALVRRWLDTAKGERQPEPPDPDTTQVEDDLRRALGTQVAWRRRSGGNGGVLSIQVYSDEEFDALYRRLVGEDGW